jgi:hypothetical protein
MPPRGFDISRLKLEGPAHNQYKRQLERLAAEGKQVDCIENAVDGAIENLKSGKRSSFVIYGEPQSGKTEMMICLTARLLDEGKLFILHLLNDSVDLLGQNLGRFQKSGIAPAAKNFTDILDPSIPVSGRQHVVFCKKNPKDLEKLLDKIGRIEAIAVVDDEADYASPNSKINQKDRTKINSLITKSLGATGDYIGVTATPARLDLNNTFENDSSTWVNFPPHRNYTGQDVFFPLEPPRPGLPFRLNLLPEQYDAPKYARDAFFRFLVGVASLNLRDGEKEQNYSMLIHTSGKRVDHKADRAVFDKTIAALINRTSKSFAKFSEEIWKIASDRYGEERADEIATYILKNISRYATFVLNSDRDFVQNGASATNPSSLFTIIIGGNIVSRGVTFENLLSMFFTRDVKHKMQQDTYIQRARMFGSRGKYLSEFELTIPDHLYKDWHRCFVFHRLALFAIQRNLGSPVWLTNTRIAAVASSSIDRSTVDVDRGEMGFHLFDFDLRYDDIAKSGVSALQKLEQVAALIGNEAFPGYLKEFIVRSSTNADQMIALHPSSPISGYKSEGIDKERIERKKGLMGKSQLNMFPSAVHHLKLFTNEAGKARMFYKFVGSIQFMKNAIRDR